MVTKTKAKDLYRLFSECPELLRVCDGKFNAVKTRVDFFDAENLDKGLKNLPIAFPRDTLCQVWFSWTIAFNKETVPHGLNVKKLPLSVWLSPKEICNKVLDEFENVLVKDDFSDLPRVFIVDYPEDENSVPDRVVVLHHKQKKGDYHTLWHYLQQSVEWRQK